MQTVDSQIGDDPEVKKNFTVNAVIAKTAANALKNRSLTSPVGKD